MICFSLSAIVSTSTWLVTAVYIVHTCPDCTARLELGQLLPKQHVAASSAIYSLHRAPIVLFTQACAKSISLCT